MSEETKKCTKCREVKSLIDFSKDRSRKDGLSNRCKVCDRSAVALYQRSNKEKMREAHRRKVAKNPDLYRKIKANSRARSRKNEKEVEAKERANLGYRYVKNRLGIWGGECPNDLIELKREQLKIHRLARELKKTVKECCK